MKLMIILCSKPISSTQYWPCSLCTINEGLRFHIRKVQKNDLVFKTFSNLLAFHFKKYLIFQARSLENG